MFILDCREELKMDMEQSCRAGLPGAEKQLPIARNEDVEFQMELADEDDLEALERSHEADDRQEHL
jgi:hypothetical protein